MTVFLCHCGSAHDSSVQGPCPTVVAFPVPTICPHCGDTFMVNGECPVCSQQVTYHMDGRSFPLSIITGGAWRSVRLSGRSAGPRGHNNTCAVVDMSDTEYLTACGQVTTRNLSVWSQPPNCAACRRALREIAEKGGR